MIVRLAGMIVFGLCIQSFCCPSFLFEADKKKFFQTRIAFWLLEVMVGLYGGYYLHALDKTAMMVYFGAVVIYGVVLFYGFYLCEQQLGEYQQQVDISMMESEASFNASFSKHSLAEGQVESEGDKKHD